MTLSDTIGISRFSLSHLPARFLLLQQPLAFDLIGEGRDSRSSAPWYELFPLICSVPRLPCVVTHRRQPVCPRALALPGSNFVS